MRPLSPKRRFPTLLSVDALATGMEPAGVRFTRSDTPRVRRFDLLGSDLCAATPHRKRKIFGEKPDPGNRRVGHPQVQPRSNPDQTQVKPRPSPDQAVVPDTREAYDARAGKESLRQRERYRRSSVLLSRRDILVGAAGIAGAATLARPIATVFAAAAQPSTPVNFDVPPAPCDWHPPILGRARRFPFDASRSYPPESPSVAEMRSLHRALPTERV